MDIAKEVAEIQRDPDKQIEFIEKVYEELLLPHQKLFLKFMIKNKERGVYFNYPFRNGKTMMRDFMDRWKDTFEKSE